VKNATSLVSIGASGVAKAEFTSVSYNARVITRGASGPAAKQAAKKIIDQIKQVIAAHKASAGLDTDRLVTDYSVTDEYRYDNATSQQVHVGYMATYSVSFSGTVIDKATALHDALTSIAGAACGSPQFHVKATAELETAAFKDAVTNAKARFAAQCAALDLDADDYQVVTWNMREEQASRGKMMALAAEASVGIGDDPIKLEPGKAEFRVNVTVTFGRKDELASMIA
jgi:uncharacterized protein YggE